MRNGLFQRWVGLVIAASSGGAATLLWFAVSSPGPIAGGAPAETILFGIWDIFYDSRAPSLRHVLAATAITFLLAAAVALWERRVTRRSRRRAHLHTMPLSPKKVMAATTGIYAGPVTVTVLIPAHNEERSLPSTLFSLLTQSRRPARVIVVADNCTDSTASVARTAGAEVLESVHNSHKKAGALNQALTALLPGLGANDVVMIMDADTRLDQGFLDAAVQRFTRDRALMAVGGLFHGEDGHGILGQFQRNEYIRYARELRRRRGRVFVLTGTASLFRSTALRAVSAHRGESLPGAPGEVYDIASLTEDNELTIALKSLGALMISPAECTVVTELMPTWKTLWSQRLRWQRGALENIGAYGVTPQTFRYWTQQMAIGYGVIALSSYLLLIGLMLVSVDTWIWFPFWLGLGVIFSLERLVTVWDGGWRARTLALMVFPELFYDMYLNVVFVKGIMDISFGRQSHWKHLTHPLTVRAAGPAAVTIIPLLGGPQTGILFPESVLYSDAFAVLSAFVAINTVMYAALAIIKILPKLHPEDWISRRRERAETRSINPTDPI